MQSDKSSWTGTYNAITSSELPSLQLQQKSLTVSVPRPNLQRNLHGQTAASLNPHGHSLGLVIVSNEDVFFCGPQRGWDNQGHSQQWKPILVGLRPYQWQATTELVDISYSQERVSTLFVASSSKSSQKAAETKPSEIYPLNQDHLGQEGINSCPFHPFFSPQCHDYQLHVNFKRLVLVEHVIP